jgi:hypothetical protein
MKYLNIMKNYFAPTVLGAITIDSYRRQVLSLNKELTEVKNMTNEQLIGLQHQLQAEQSINSSCRVTLEASSPEIKVLESEISRVKSVLDNIDFQLNTKNFNIGENMETLNNKQKYYSDELNNLIIKKDSNVNELLDKINSIINKSDISSYLSDIVEKYQSILSNLNLDQMVALFNIFGFFMILVTIFNLTTVLIGDYLIDNLKLENKYPKLTKYIKFKQNLNKGYLTFYYLILYIITISFILCNIYILLMRYFI